MDHGTDGYRIAAVEELTGVGAHTIRAWERRYGIPRPARSDGGQRLYTGDDIDALRRMAALARAGMSLSAAARAVAESPAPPGPIFSSSAMLTALLAFDEPAASAAWNAAVAASDSGTAMLTVAVPALQQIGDLWHEGRATVAQEHFATAFVRSRIEALARQVTPSTLAEPVVLACLEGERHEIGLLMLALLLRHRGLRPIYLGADLPADLVERTTVDVGAPVVAIHASGGDAAEAVAAFAGELAAIAPATRVVYGGRPFDAGQTVDLPSARYGGSDLPRAADLIARLSRAATAGATA